MLMGSIAETDTKLIIFSQTFILGVSKKNHSPNYTQKMGRKMTSTMHEPFVNVFIILCHGRESKYSDEITRYT